MAAKAARQAGRSDERTLLGGPGPLPGIPEVWSPDSEEASNASVDMDEASRKAWEQMNERDKYRRERAAQEARLNQP